MASYFDYHVKNGGFGQLIYNLDGVDLDQCGDMLSAVGAPIASSYYFRALLRCAQDLEQYDEFMSDFAAPSDLWNDLAMITVDYFSANTSFDDEIAEFLDTAEARF